MMDGSLILFILLALALGVLLGWLLGGRPVAGLAAERDALRAERDGHLDNFRGAARDLEAADREREVHAIALARINAEREADVRAHAAQVQTLTEARDALAAQFQDVAAKMLSHAQTSFLEAAGERFKASEQEAGHRLAQLLAPVNERLSRYEETVGKIEKERQEAYGSLHALMHDMRRGQDAVRETAANLMNSLRNAPKARGRWGEQQLRNVMESCGLAEHVDFLTEVSLDTVDGRLRPDAIVRVPGGRNLVIDAKVSLNAYQDAFNAPGEAERTALLVQHSAAIKNHVATLGAKAYQDQFDDAPDFVVMFIPGEHFLAAALEQDPGLWDYAFGRRVLLATPTNLVAIARTVAGVWRQERMADQAREIGQLGKELYARMTTMGAHIARVGKNLDTAVGAYNSFVGSFESQVLTQARRFEALDIDTGGKAIDPLPMIDTAARAQTKLSVAPPPEEEAAE
jgi:DNA recombination protein RmuC